MIKTNECNGNDKEEFVRRDNSKLALGIFEDSKEDLVRRYNSLNEKYEIYAYLRDGRHDFYDDQSDDLKKYLAEDGLDVERVYTRVGKMPTTLDLYFTDGLDFDCFSVAKKFGKDKTFILTGDPLIKKMARERGNNLAETGLDEIIRRYLRREL